MSNPPILHALVDQLAARVDARQWLTPEEQTNLVRSLGQIVDGSRAEVVQFRRRGAVPMPTGPGDAA